jgi:propionate CoA-transferase
MNGAISLMSMNGVTLVHWTRRLPCANNGGIVIAQVKRVAAAGTMRPQQVFVPGILVDAIVVAPEQTQTRQTVFDPAICGEIFRPMSSFRIPEFNIEPDRIRWEMYALKAQR